MYWNPANSKATLAYFLQNITEAKLQIFDSSLRLAFSENLNMNERSKILEFDSFKPGLYIYNIIQEDHVISSGKFSIVH